MPKSPRRVVPNTVTEDLLNPYLAVLVGSEAIVSQERQGRAALTKAEQIPKDLAKDHKATLEKLGFKIHGPTPGDDLFYNADLPPGWTKQPDSEDYRTTNILDDKGRVRAYMWYKAASYDRAAYGGVHRRFEIIVLNRKDYTEKQCFLVDRLDRKTYRVIYKTDPVKVLSNWEEKDLLESKLHAQAIAWATRRGIDIKDPTAYWEDLAHPEVCAFPGWK